MNKPSEATIRRIAENLSAFTCDLFNCLDTGIYSDDEIEYWGRFFVDNKFAARGILFETFMICPFEISQAVLLSGRRQILAGDEVEPRPLLPRQRDAAQHARVEMSGRQCGKSIRTSSRPLHTDDLVFLKHQAD